MKISLVIPFIDQVDITKHCIETVFRNAGSDFELVLIDNGSEHKNSREIGRFATKLLKDSVTLGIFHRNDENLGVLSSFKQGLEIATGDVICFIHNDVLIHEQNWVSIVDQAFSNNPQLGLAGIFGAVGVGDNGGRIRPQSNMLGAEWGSCECHQFAWQHHSEHLNGLAPATILDGVGMFFSRKALTDLASTDMFDDWRAMHHFYDRIMPLKLIDKGYKIATIGLGFDHWSGATANSSVKYAVAGRKWLGEQKGVAPFEGMNADQLIYTFAEQQFFDEFGSRIPCNVDSNWDYQWRGVR